MGPNWARDVSGRGRIEWRGKIGLGDGMGWLVFW